MRTATAQEPISVGRHFYAWTVEGVMRLGFGKYAQRDTSEADTQYLQWLLTQNWIFAALRRAIEQELSKRENSVCETVEVIGLVKQARRDLAKQYHSDRGGAPGVMVGINIFADYLLEKLA